MEREKVDVRLLETDSQVKFGAALAAYSALAEQMFPGTSPNIAILHNHLTDLNVKISRRRLYELNQLRSCVHEPWFSEDLRRQEIRALKVAAKEHPSYIQLAAVQRDQRNKPRDVFLEMASRIGAAAGIKVKQGEHSPYVVDLSSIKRHDPRAATIACALMQAVPAFGGSTPKHLLILEHARTWPEPVLADSLEHVVIEVAKRLGYAPAWALSAGSRILYEPCVEACIRQDFLTLMGLKRTK